MKITFKPLKSEQKKEKQTWFESVSAIWDKERLGSIDPDIHVREMYALQEQFV